jgi:hypothetical protein
MQALYFKASYERLRDRIHAAAPDLDVVLYDEAGRLWHHGVEVLPKDIKPDWCWIHSELFFSPMLHEYFRLMLHMPSLKWLHTVNTGLDKLPYLELVEKGVTVTNNHAQAIAIAEFVFGQLRQHALRIEAAVPQHWAAIEQGAMNRHKQTMNMKNGQRVNEHVARLQRSLGAPARAHRVHIQAPVGM